MKLILIVFSFKDEEKNLLELVNRVTKVFEEIKSLDVSGQRNQVIGAGTLKRLVWWFDSGIDHY